MFRSGLDLCDLRGSVLTLDCMHIFIVVIDIQEKPHLEIFMLFTWNPPAVLEHFLRLRTLKQTSLLTS